MPDLNVDTSRPVLVTGATGYVAGRLIERLLDEGLTVHATVRDASKTERLQPLNDLAASRPGTLRFFSADLLDPGAFAEGMAGCGVVFHTASPFTLNVQDPQRDLVDPAVKGTRNVLEQAARTESVTRVVVTSSCAAIYGDSADLEDTPDGVFTEAVWNTSSNLHHGAYAYSKTLAEQEAWRLAETQDGYKLVVVNPSMVMGPGIHAHHTSESFDVLKQIGDGTLRMGVPDIRMGLVDVRDLAEAHLRAAFIDEASGRYIISGHNSGFVEFAQVLREPYGSRFPIPTRPLPKWLLWLVGPLVNASITRRFVNRNVGKPWVADNSKSVRELGMRYRSVQTTVRDFFEQLVQAGIIGG